METKTTVLPVFLEHAGCPHRCAYCNQRRLVGQVASAVDQVDRLLDAFSVSEKRPQALLAFYGGDFLGIDPTIRQGLLTRAKNHPNFGAIEGFHASVRPDTLDRQAARWLVDRGFRSVEVGAQVLDDSVLDAIGRGHRADDVKRAVVAARAEGLGVGLHLMLGLPGQTQRIIDESNRRAAACRPDSIRVFPVVVLEGTELAAMYRRGQYEPWSLERALEQACATVAFFHAQGIPTIQIGLHPSEPMVNGKSVVAGPFHPRFGERVRQRLACLAARLAIRQAGHGGPVSVEVAPADLSLFTGSGKSGLHWLRKRTGLANLQVGVSRDVQRGAVRACGSKGGVTVSLDRIWPEQFAQGNET